MTTEIIDKEQVIIRRGGSGGRLFSKEPNTNLLAVRLNFNEPGN